MDYKEMKRAQSLKSRTKRGGGGICMSHPFARARAESKPFYDSCNKGTLDGLTDKIVSLYTYNKMARASSSMMMMLLMIKYC
jgi:hypothetical protein